MGLKVRQTYPWISLAGRGTSVSYFLGFSFEKKQIKIACSWIFMRIKQATICGTQNVKTVIFPEVPRFVRYGIPKEEAPPNNKFAIEVTKNQFQKSLRNPLVRGRSK